jgi:predicted RNase H-like nuclease
VQYIGVDLAWGQNGMTGLAAADGQGTLAEATQVRTDAEILAWLAPVTTGPCVVAMDAPIVVRNAAGSRSCEKLVGRYFGGYGAFCHPSNTANPVFAASTRALRIANDLGLDIDPASGAARRAIEVYPHPAIVALFGLPSIVRYKAKPRRDLELLRSETLRLLTLIERLEDDSVPLRARDCPAWIRIRRSVRAATTKAALARVEDSIDAVVCAHVGRLAAACPDRVRVLGTVGDGYILTPVTPQIAARIDADLRNSPGSPVGAGVRVTLNQGPGRVPEVGEAR